MSTKNWLLAGLVALWCKKPVSHAADMAFLLRLWIGRRVYGVQQLVRRPPYGIPWREWNSWRWTPLVWWWQGRQQCCGALKPSHKFGCARRSR